MLYVSYPPTGLLLRKFDNTSQFSIFNSQFSTFIPADRLAFAEIRQYFSIFNFQFSITKTEFYMLKKLLIQNGAVLYRKNLIAADVLIADGKIARVAPGLRPDRKTDVIDARGLLVLPGFIDLHCHLRDPGQTHKEDVASGGRSAAAGGFTAVCCMPNTEPPIDCAPMVSYVRQKAERESPVKVYPIGAVTKGRGGAELAELGLMREAGAVAASDDGSPVMNAGLMRAALEYAVSAGLFLISHCEDTSLSGDGVANEGYNASLAGLKGIPRAAEEVMVARDVLLAETLNTRVHIAHVSTKGGVQLLREAKRRGARVTAETCPHYFALTDDLILEYDTDAKINPPLREEADRQAVIRGLADGTIDAIATDHAPHNFDGKNVDFNAAAFGTVGFETAFAVAYTTLVKGGILTVAELSALMSAKPAAVLGFEGGGAIRLGLAADLAVVDPEAVWTVEPDKLLSKSKNTVFKGRELTGKVRYTVVDGKVVYGGEAKGAR
ncbi:MAG: dihydroorotase [Clostridiales bacterium]|nr:dihydroorotase [Clostridiales bacterium]